MHYTLTHQRAGSWPEEKAVDTLTLDFDARHHRRIRLTTDKGEDVLLYLPNAVAMADGDGLQLEDGRWIAVRAAAEVIVEISHDDPERLVSIAWHLGNRHVQTDVRRRVLHIRPDHVIEDMLEGLGAQVRTVQATFQPEAGAYVRSDQQHSRGDGLHDHD